MAKQVNAAHFRKLEAMYHGAPINKYFAPKLSIQSAGNATVSIPLREDFYHAAHAVHGSVYFKALDDANFFAVQSIEPTSFVLTASFQLEVLFSMLLDARMRSNIFLVEASSAHDCSW